MRSHVIVRGPHQKVVRVAVLVLLSALVAVILISCDKMDGSSMRPNHLSPPSWIIGTWRSDFGTIKWTFSSDNAVSHSSSGSPLDFRETERRIPGTVTDSSSSNYYEVTSSIDSERWRFTFRRTSSLTLDYSVWSSLSGIAGPLELTKL